MASLLSVVEYANWRGGTGVPAPLMLAHDCSQITASVQISSNMLSDSSPTIRESLRNTIHDFLKAENSPLRQNTEQFQLQIKSLIDRFETLQRITESLALFSENEPLSEIATAHLPFLTIPYYQASLLQKFTWDPSAPDPLQVKADNLDAARSKILEFLTQIGSLKLLERDQLKRLDEYRRSSSSSKPSPTTIGDPATRRARKIEAFRAETKLKQQVSLLESYYESDKDNPTFFQSEDDSGPVREACINQLRLFILSAFNALNLIETELQVLSQRKQLVPNIPDSRQDQILQDPTGYTTRLEANPNRPQQILDLLSRQGKILQPFVITKTRQDMKKKVFGTGQVLPSMSVEEYLDYELANGKMAPSSQPHNSSDDSSDDDDSEVEYRKRAWDDWKDDNPKGSGNMKANLG